ncbi:TPM domain-containing protein [Sphingomonas swuensis]|uniref:TPM domain-containing protein n=1 Tax=Sphingomonas swuensis TaxID=977800 RepID=A0ABP7SJ53_9SPHN
MVTLALRDEDHRRVSEAIAAAESSSDGEILTIVSADSDSYHDVALHWAVLAMLGVLAFASWQAPMLSGWWERWLGDWGQAATTGQILFLVLVLVTLKFLGVLLLLRWRPLRLALTPGATKTRRVRRRAIALFRAAAERRTTGRTGVLIYLSLAEHRAEIVADEAVTSVTTPECWGDAMAELVGELRAGRPGEGLALAVEEVGEVLTRHFPKTSTDTNEIPDKLIVL